METSIIDESNIIAIVANPRSHTGRNQILERRQNMENRLIRNILKPFMKQNIKLR